jgi:hypothetical protein
VTPWLLRYPCWDASFRQRDCWGGLGNMSIGMNGDKHTHTCTYYLIWQWMQCQWESARTRVSVGIYIWGKLGTPNFSFFFSCILRLWRAAGFGDRWVCLKIGYPKSIKIHWLHLVTGWSLLYQTLPPIFNCFRSWGNGAPLLLLKNSESWPPESWRLRRS